MVRQAIMKVEILISRQVKKAVVLLSTLLIILHPNTAVSTQVYGWFAPVDRLVKNSEAYVMENPEDPHGYYILGRIHYFAFMNRVPWVRGTAKVSPPALTPGWEQRVSQYDMPKLQAVSEKVKELGYPWIDEIPREKKKDFWESVKTRETQLRDKGWVHEELNTRELVNHMKASLPNLRRAVELSPDNGLYHLGLASFMEQVTDFVEGTDLDTLSSGIVSFDTKTICDGYFRAYELSISSDLEREYLEPYGLRKLVGYEAGKGFLRSLESAGSLTLWDRWRKFWVKRSLSKLEDKPSFITPIIFTFDDHTELRDLLAPYLLEPFDLDGDGFIELWPWVKPTTGILVWDPDKEGNITSGRQLFGSVTWWLFFEDGYHSLSALDDNRDGELSGLELDGISIWFDDNSNGISDPGEVVPIEETEISALATNPDSLNGRCLMNRRGVTLNDGETLPSYDWIVMPVESFSEL
jgi:hypothetical protein